MLKISYFIYCILNAFLFMRSFLSLHLIYYRRKQIFNVECLFEFLTFKCKALQTLLYLQKGWMIKLLSQLIFAFSFHELVCSSFTLLISLWFNCFFNLNFFFYSNILYIYSFNLKVVSLYVRWAIFQTFALICCLSIFWPVFSMCLFNFFQ